MIRERKRKIEDIKDTIQLLAGELNISIFYCNNKLVFKDDPAVWLPLRAELQKVRLFDYDEGLVSYDVEASVSHIYSASGSTF